MKNKWAPSDIFLCGHLLVAEPAPLSFKTGGWEGRIQAPSPLAPPPPRASQVGGHHLDLLALVSRQDRGLELQCHAGGLTD